MILRNCALRHGRRAMPSPVGTSRLAIRALSTDGRQPPLPTAYADPATTAPPPPPPPAQDAAAPGGAQVRGAQVPGGPLPTADPAGQPLWQGPSNPMARWNRKRGVKLDKARAQEFKIQKKIEYTSGELGSVVHRRFRPSSLLQDPPRPEDVTLELLMASQTHMGHHTARWNPANQRYIYGVRDNIHIISLEETAAALRRAAKVVEEIAYLGGLILFVGNRKGQMEITARAAELAGACHLFTKWVPGTITNRDQILGKEDLRIVDERDRPVEGYERLLLEKRPLMPELVVVLNPMENFVLLHECAQENIPTIGLIDTNADPTRVTYCIPGNDDSLRAVSVIAGVLGRAGEAGQQRRKRDAEKGLCTWRTSPDIKKWMRENQAKEALSSAAASSDAAPGEEDAELDADEFAAAEAETGVDEDWEDCDVDDFDGAVPQDPSVLPETRPGRRPVGLSGGQWVYAVETGFPEEVGLDKKGSAKKSAGAGKAVAEEAEGTEKNVGGGAVAGVGKDVEAGKNEGVAQDESARME